MAGRYTLPTPAGMLQVPERKLTTTYGADWAGLRFRLTRRHPEAGPGYALGQPARPGHGF